MCAGPAHPLHAGGRCPPRMRGGGRLYAVSKVACYGLMLHFLSRLLGLDLFQVTKGLPTPLAAQLVSLGFASSRLPKQQRHLNIPQPTPPVTPCPRPHHAPPLPTGCAPGYVWSPDAAACVPCGYGRFCPGARATFASGAISIPCGQFKNTTTQFARSDLDCGESASRGDVLKPTSGEGQGCHAAVARFKQPSQSKSVDAT